MKDNTPGAPEPAERRRFERGTGPHGLVTSRDMDPINLRAPSSPPQEGIPRDVSVALRVLHDHDMIEEAETLQRHASLGAPSSPPPPATPSEAAIEAMKKAHWPQDFELSNERLRWVLRAAYAVDFGAQSRPEAKHQEGR